MQTHFVKNNNKKANQKQIKVIIEKSNDFYTSYALDVPGIYGHGNTVDEAKNPP